MQKYIQIRNWAPFEPAFVFQTSDNKMKELVVNIEKCIHMLVYIRQKRKNKFDTRVLKSYILY